MTCLNLTFLIISHLSSAGVWHNFVLCVTALAFLFLLPVFLFPMYSTGAGALVSEVVQVSAAGHIISDELSLKGSCVHQTFGKCIFCVFTTRIKTFDGVMKNVYE